MRPKKSISQELTPRLTSYLSIFNASPKPMTPPGMRCLLPPADTSTAGQSSPRAMP